MKYFFINNVNPYWYNSESCWCIILFLMSIFTTLSTIFYFFFSQFMYALRHFRLPMKNTQVVFALLSASLYDIFAINSAIPLLHSLILPPFRVYYIITYKIIFFFYLKCNSNGQTTNYQVKLRLGSYITFRSHLYLWCWYDRCVCICQRLTSPPSCF